MHFQTGDLDEAIHAVSVSTARTICIWTVAQPRSTPS